MRESLFSTLWYDISVKLWATNVPEQRLILKSFQQTSATTWPLIKAACVVCTGHPDSEPYSVSMLCAHHLLPLQLNLVTTLTFQRGHTYKHQYHEHKCQNKYFGTCQLLGVDSGYKYHTLYCHLLGIVQGCMGWEMTVLFIWKKMAISWDAIKTLVSRAHMIVKNK